LFPLTEGTIRGLHHTLLSFYPAAQFYAGGYKTSPNQVISVNHNTGERRVVLDPTPPGPHTEAAMRALVQWYNQTIREHAWPLLVATEFVFRFLAIHFFQDGNGRLGRALFLLALMQGDDPDFSKVIRFISIDRQIERHRPLYYSVLHQASGGRFHEDTRLYQLVGDRSLPNPERRCHDHQTYRPYIGRLFPKGPGSPSGAPPIHREHPHFAIAARPTPTV
jgi:Fic family protein